MIFIGKSTTLFCVIYQSAKMYSMECGMIYRRVTEVTEIDQQSIPDLPNHWSQRPSFGRSGFNIQPPTMGPFLKRKRSMASWDREDLSLSEQVRSFKRVRILSNIKRTRRPAFASWEEKTSWGPVASDDHFENKSTWTIVNGASPKSRPRRQSSDIESSSLLKSRAYTPDTADDDCKSASENCVSPAENAPSETDTQRELLSYSKLYRGCSAERDDEDLPTGAGDDSLPSPALLEHEESPPVNLDDNIMLYPWDNWSTWNEMSF